jgi:hypothetical protein
MDNPPLLDSQSPARMVAGALAHLARHMETGCPRAAYLAAMLLEQVANDSEADAHLRAHARELVEILERDDPHDKDHDAREETTRSRPFTMATTRRVPN